MMEKNFIKIVLKCIFNYVKNSLKWNKIIYFKLIFWFKLKEGFFDMCCDYKCELFRLLVCGIIKLILMVVVWLDWYRIIIRIN